ncbi:hypothetical protein [Gimesia maris]|uniref:hypothetical protein n=1 Tax=Gimesia maris TaxID=122 RepID=UPI0032EB1D3F
MPECSNCGYSIDPSAEYCEVWGKRDPTDFKANALIVFCLFLAVLFLAPAIICIYPFSFGMWNSLEIALTSEWAWTSSSAFWGTLLLIYKSKNPRAFDMLVNLGIFMWIPLLIYSCYQMLKAF